MSAFNEYCLDISELNLLSSLVSELNALNTDVLEINFTVDNVFNDQTPKLNENKVEQKEWIKLFYFLDNQFDFYYQAPFLLSAALYDKEHSLLLRIQFFPVLFNQCTYVSFQFSHLNNESFYYDLTKSMQEKLQMEESIAQKEKSLDKNYKI